MEFQEYSDSVLKLFRPVKHMPELAYHTLALNEEAGELAGKIKKLYRDDEGVLTEERRKLALWECGDVLAYLAATARALNSTLDEVAQMNLDKLYDRKDRGTLKGDGDKR